MDNQDHFGKCWLCKAPIPEGSRRRIYCSDDCATKARKKQASQSWRKNKGNPERFIGAKVPCEQCGTEITIRNPRHKRCKVCSLQRRRERNRNRQRKLRKGERTDADSHTQD